MGATVYQERKQAEQQVEGQVEEQVQEQVEEQKQPKLAFKDRVLQFTKAHKKRTSTDVTMGAIITAGLFLISLV